MSRQSPSLYARYLRPSGTLNISDDLFLRKLSGLLGIKIRPSQTY
jgi:hypothetical protein